MLEVNIHNAHCILGIEKDATKTVIKKAFRKKALSCHPDKNPDDPKAASEIFVQLCQAQAILLDNLIVSQNNSTAKNDEENTNVPENFPPSSESSDEHQVCPMCEALFPKNDVTLEEFVTHVNSHFNFEETTTNDSPESSANPNTNFSSFGQPEPTTFKQNAQNQQDDNGDDGDFSMPMDFGARGNTYSQFYGSQRTRRWYSNYRSHTGIWKTSRNTNQNHHCNKSNNNKYHSSIEVDLEDVPFQPNKCDRIMASIILSSIVGGFLFCLIYGYVKMHTDYNDGKIDKKHFFKRQDY